MAQHYIDLKNNIESCREILIALYLNKGYLFNLMTPYFAGDLDYATTFGIYSSQNEGIISSEYNSENGVVPVINIKPEYVTKFIGDGTATNPYRLPED